MNDYGEYIDEEYIDDDGELKRWSGTFGRHRSRRKHQESPWLSHENFAETLAMALKILKDARGGKKEKP